jgi:serine/threonine protein kinase
VCCASAGCMCADLKPSNCFLAADGSVKIGDFNVAKVMQDTRNANVRHDAGNANVH